MQPIGNSNCLYEYCDLVAVIGLHAAYIPHISMFYPRVMTDSRTDSTFLSCRDKQS